MEQDQLNDVVAALDNIAEALQEQPKGECGSTIADSLEGIAFYLMNISETLEKIEQKLK